MLVWVRDDGGNSIEQVWTGKKWDWTIAGFAAVLMEHEPSWLTVKNAHGGLIGQCMVVHKRDTNDFMINYVPPPGRDMSETERWDVTLRPKRTSSMPRKIANQNDDTKLDDMDVNKNGNRTFRVIWEIDGKPIKHDVNPDGSEYEVMSIDKSSTENQRRGYITS